MKCNRIYRYFCYLACGGALLQATGCDAGSILGNLAASVLINALLGGIAT